MEAAAWYDEQRLGLGQEFLIAVESTLDDVSRHRVPGVPIRRLEDLGEVRRIAVARFPYQLVINVTTKELLIVAVMHERRRPEYWIAA